MPLLFSGESLEPLSCGGLFWPAQDALLVADLHLEKASHYAARGWPLPPWDSEATLTRLEAALAATGAARLLCLGDSFHDPEGPARLPEATHAALARIAETTEIVWITGNHDDGAAASLFGAAHEELSLSGLWLRHRAAPHDPRPELSGHFHPKVRIRHKGRTISRRCFALSPTKLILPAYGSLAGGLAIDDPALAQAAPGGLQALICEAGRLLRFPVAA